MHIQTDLLLDGSQEGKTVRKGPRGNMQIGTRNRALGAASLLYRGKLSCKVKQQVQKISHIRGPAGHPEPLRPRGKEEIVRVKFSLLGVENSGKGGGPPW